MTLIDPAFAGPAHATDIDAYEMGQDNAASAHTFVTDGGKDYFQIGSENAEIAVALPQSVASQRYHWLDVAEAGLFETSPADLGSGEVLHAVEFESVRLELIQDGGSLDDYLWRLWDTASNEVRVTGATRFSKGTYQEIRIQQDGHTWQLWVDGVNDGQAADGNRANTGKIELGGRAWTVDNVLRLRGIGIRASDDGRDRPDPSTVTMGAKYPDGDVTSNYSDTNCLDDNNGDYTQWDDWNGGSADDATSFNCGVSGNSETELSSFTDPTVNNVVSTYFRGRARTNVTAKVVATSVVSRVGATEEVKANNSFTSTAWRTVVGHYFDRQPDGTAWDQTALDANAWGVRTFSGNGAHDQWTAIFAEAWGLTTDPLVSFPPISPLRAMRPLLVR